MAEDVKRREDKMEAAENLISRSGLAHSMQVRRPQKKPCFLAKNFIFDLTRQDLLAEYILLEDFFMSQNIGKAIQASSARAASSSPDDFGVGGTTSEVDGGDPTTSVLLDDVFFLLKKCVQRAVGGHNVDGVCAVINNACGILEQDFCGMLQSQVSGREEQGIALMCVIKILWFK